jgi:phosphoglycolate phosphatase-like HAD superfamily hydrolase
MAAVRPTVLLFDIDGTLIASGGAGRRAMEGAFARHTGRSDACAHFRFDGMTDRAIVRTGLLAVERRADEAEIDAVIALYLELLAGEVVASSSYRTHPGVLEVLDCAAGVPGFAIGLGTGNVRDGARIKLDRVGIFDRFAFGGFGCDHEDRAELLRVGAARGAHLLGLSPERCRVVVIGDTPRDVAAARAIGAESLAVATGHYGPDDLAAAGPTRVCASLDLPEAASMLFP